MAEGVTYRQFAAMAKIAGWTADELGAEFRGIAEREPAPSYFARVLRGEPDSGVVIPFGSVIAKYVRASRHLIAEASCARALAAADRRSSGAIASRGRIAKPALEPTGTAAKWGSLYHDRGKGASSDFDALCGIWDAKAGHVLEWTR